MTHAIAIDQAHADCTRITFEFFRSLDMRAHDQAVELFTANGVWERNGKQLKGHTEIADALAGRSSERTTFHAVCNPIVLIQGVSRVTRAEVHFFLMAYEAVAGGKEIIPPAAIRRCVDVLEYDGERWRIAHKSSTRHMPGEA